MKPTRTWHAGHMLFALARYFNWWEQRMATEVELGSLREDLVVISRAGYVTVVEIKVTRSDWLKDRQKLRRWPSPLISRFFYAVPEPVFKQGIPDHVPSLAGLLVVNEGGNFRGYDSVHEQRPAFRMKAEKLSASRERAITQSFYYRFWRQQMELLAGRFHERDRATA